MLPRYHIIPGSACTSLVTQFMIWKCLRRHLVNVLLDKIEYFYPNYLHNHGWDSQSDLWVFIWSAFPGHTNKPWHDCTHCKIQQNDHFPLKLGSHEKWFSYCSIHFQGIRVPVLQTQVFCFWEGHPNQQVCSLLEAWQKVLSASWCYASTEKIFRLFDATEEGERTL